MLKLETADPNNQRVLIEDVRLSPKDPCPLFHYPSLTFIECHPLQSTGEN